jgi:hypothetical protein
MSMSTLYGMQRANGDWFAQQRREGVRVPVFSTDADAMKARAYNVEMLLFRPVLLDEEALKEFGSVEGNGGASFWLVKNGSTNMNRGEFLKFAELARVVRGA